MQMRGAAMGSPAAASWFVVFLISLSVVQGHWRVTYTPTEICALQGSSVNIRCTFTYYSRVNDRDTAVEKAFWFRHSRDSEPVDLRADSMYAGRVQQLCENNSCTLRITDLRKMDSAQYKCGFIINQPDWKYTDSSGVTLSVTGLEVQVSEVPSLFRGGRLRCHSVCHLPGYLSYVWYKNGQKTVTTLQSYSGDFKSADSYSCAVRGQEDYPSPSKCSSVDISCTYNSYGYISSDFWFNPKRTSSQYSSWPEDLTRDSQYKGRVQVETKRGRSTLRITNLTESDSAQYCFRTGSFEWTSPLPGTTLTVTDPDIQVLVIWSSTGRRLICQSSCITDRFSFVWYKNRAEIQRETSRSYRGYVDPAGIYSCSYKGYTSLPVYAPVVPSVLISPHGDIMKGSSVTLTCSSDAFPPAKYTWYKKNQPLPNRELQLVLNSIQSSHSGEYYCTAENELGKTTSKYVFVNVKYAPNTSIVSVSPSGEIVEGSSVTLTCSSDANPAANYTWYKENQTLLQGPEGIYRFTSISSTDSGIYLCKSENQYRQINSSSLCIDVLYAPKLPSVSVSPSGEIVEGSSVTLTCSSDANPAANYIWYKENEDSPKASGQNFTITDFRGEHSGNYYCEAQNRRGHHNSTLHLIVVAGAGKSAAIATTTAVLLVIILLAILLWIRRNKSFTQQCQGGERPDNRAQLNIGPVSDNMSAAAEEQEDLQYANIHLCLNREEALYSNIRPAQPHRQNEEEESVEYTIVKTDNARSAPGTTNEEDEEYVFALYSTVNKNNVTAT
ncbi:B-cell receptor CD22-like isoform X2 [Chelmon rostratus]|uniref:B-cell receptor CD22-like isoform X2 n=1 Tax=Chelmon rostratus TaxID=109905 RepID=UPI001BE823BA|nr:B-cell receptor CD22-like isoform X2 [Chelmon rostratus]